MFSSLSRLKSDGQGYLELFAKIQMIWNDNVATQKMPLTVQCAKLKARIMTATISDVKATNAEKSRRISLI
jgi:hypothetical protein